MSGKFRKEERLKSRKTIEALFKAGKSVKAFPIIAVYLEDQDFEGAKVAFSVSKRKIKRAVDRNLVKRRMLEAYRLNRDAFGIQECSGLALMLIYVTPELNDFHFIEKKICRVLEKLGRRNSIEGQQSNSN